MTRNSFSLSVAEEVAEVIHAIRDGESDEKVMSELLDVIGYFTPRVESDFWRDASVGISKYFTVEVTQSADLFLLLIDRVPSIKAKVKYLMQDEGVQYYVNLWNDKNKAKGREGISIHEIREAVLNLTTQSYPRKTWLKVFKVKSRIHEKAGLL